MPTLVRPGADRSTQESSSTGRLRSFPTRHLDHDSKIATSSPDDPSARLALQIPTIVHGGVTVGGGLGQARDVAGRVLDSASVHPRHRS